MRDMSGDTTKDKGTVLVIDDRENMLKMMRDLLRERFEVVTSNGGAPGLEQFRNHPTDVVVTDIRMPEIGGMDVLRQVKKHNPDTEVILMTAYGEVTQAVEALKEGAYDYVIKPFEPEEMILAIEKALERKRLRERTEILQQEVEGKFGLPNVVGDSDAIRRLCEVARKAANSDATVLLTGESGTGKEVFARAIHYSGARSKGRFLAINCAAMPKDLIESELFGHVKGAFSGATRDKPGLFEQANGGTLLLDEITELPFEMQAKINRALQEREVRRVGDSRDRPVDVRIIAATNQDVRQALEDGRLREDLYFRINVFPIYLAPLREREGDIPLLARHFVASSTGGRADRYTIEPDAMQKLLDYSWPGNVRELQNAIERATVLCEDGRLTADMFLLGDDDRPRSGGRAGVPIDLSYRDAMERMRLQCQREYLIAVLKRAEGNVTKAAEAAGIERESFHRLMRKCSLRSEDVKRDLGGG